VNKMIDLPEWLENELKSQYNEEQFNKIINGYNSNRKTTFRVNTIKSNKEEIIEELEANKIEYEIINNEIVKNVQSPTIFLLENDIEIRKTKIYEEGKIYIQNLSSMIPPLFLNPKEQEDILDMAAAPGGKTTQIAAMSDNKANITACERNTIRLDKMMYNINKQGVNVYCINKNSLELDDFLKFDKILLDAPCTGTGTINYKTNFKKYLTKSLLEKTIKTQEKLLNKAIKLLKKDGELIYSTCSILKKENDEMIQKILSQNSNIHLEKIDIIEKENINIVKGINDKTITILPDENFEGFYIAKLVK
jgi:tRNA and rRNA cytosine-C5-methylases